MAPDNDPEWERILDRRRFLKITGTGAALTGLAGCTGGGGGGGDGGGGDGGDGGGGGGGGGDGGGGDMPSSVEVPGLYDTSGPTSDVGIPLSTGSREGVKWINEQETLPFGIDHPWQDYGYEVPKAKQLYDKWTSGDKPPAILGWGTADTEALAPQVARDKIVYISGSYSQKLLNPKTPFNFFASLDYATQGRVFLKWIADNDPDATAAFIFNNTPFGKAPVEPGHRYAEELGVDLADDISLELTANSATSQLRRAKQNGVDYLIHQNTSGPMQVLLKDRQEVYPEVTVMGLTYTVDESISKPQPELFKDNVMFVNAFKAFKEAIDTSDKAKKFVEQSFEAADRSMDNLRIANLNYIRGAIHTRLLHEGLKNTVDMGLDPTVGKNVQKGMFEISDFSPWDLTEPYSYEKGDRRPSMRGRIYEFDSNGVPEYMTTVELPRRDDWIPGK